MYLITLFNKSSNTLILYYIKNEKWNIPSSNTTYESITLIGSFEILRVRLNQIELKIKNKKLYLNSLFEWICTNNKVCT